MFDTLQREAAGSKQDRRAAVDLAITQESMTQAGAGVKWVPHSKMLADPLTKVNPEKGSFILQEVLDLGQFRFIDPQEELAWRAQDSRWKTRSPSFSRQRARGGFLIFPNVVKGAGGTHETSHDFDWRSEEAESLGCCHVNCKSSSDQSSHEES